MITARINSAGKTTVTMNSEEYKDKKENAYKRTSCEKHSDLVCEVGKSGKQRVPTHCFPEVSRKIKVSCCGLE